jgi:hypothetical protein
MRAEVVQTSFLSGVLDPRASGRIEADAYKEGLLTGRNIELHHLGGMKRRRGLRFRSQLPNQLTFVTPSSATAPNGGTAASGYDNSELTSVTTTTNVGATNNYVIVRYDLGSAQTILFADVMGIGCVTPGNTSTEFCVQWSTDDATWTSLPALALVDGTARDYRVAASVAARYWRVARVGVTALATHITLNGFNLWLDSGVISGVRLLPFEISVDTRLLLAITDRSGTLFQNGVFLARIPLPYLSADVLDLDADVSEGEMVITHEDYAPRVVTNTGSGNYQSEAVVFTNVPKVDYNDTQSPTPTSDVQVIALAGTINSGDTFQVYLEGARTGSIVYAGDNATTADNFAREIQKLYTVPGQTGVTGSRTAANQFTITFAAGSAKAYGLMTVSTVTGAATSTVTHSTTGVARVENVWSATRGWPRTVAFFEKRMYLGGTRSKPSSLFGSIVNDTTDFDLGEGLDDEGIFTTLTGTQTTVIQGVYPGRTLQVFTSGGEFRYVKPQGEAIKPGDSPKSQTEHGSKRIRPVAIDGTTVFVHRTGKALRDFRYDYQEDAFNSLSLTSLAPHLLDDVVDIAAWNGSQVDELSYVFAVNSDGTAVCLNLRREAEVKALSEWTTDGDFKAVGVVVEDIYFAVLRTLNGVQTLTLEQPEYDYYTDCSIQGTNSPASATITGLSHLNGVECRLRGDGCVLANVTPSGGSATAAEGTVTDWETGIDFTPEVTPMPLNAMTANGPTFMRKCRIVRVMVKVRGALGLLVNGRPLADRMFDINNFDEPPEPVSGVFELEESTNWDRDQEKLVTFTQVDPCPMEILAIEVQLESA